MKYANVSDKRKEATESGARGTCPVCNSEVIAKIYKNKINHWAHISRSECDHWWEPETQWHREWKNCFPSEWQEITHKDQYTGEVHRADVKTPFGWTIEFQHSPINADERIARNKFYNKVVWVVDGTRRSTDAGQLSILLESGVRLRTKISTFAINPKHKNRLINEWHNSESLVFFDFKQIERSSGQRIIWFVLPQLDLKEALMPQFVNDLFIQGLPAQMFIDGHRNASFDQFFTHEIFGHVNDYCNELNNIRRSYKAYRKNNPKLNWLVREK